MNDYDDRQKVVIASAYLKELALQDYMLYEQGGNKPTWIEFNNYMRNKYTPKNQSQLIRMKIRQLKQQTSVREHYIEFRKLAHQLFDMTDQDKMIAFIDGLHEKTKAYVRMQQPTNIERAYECADLYETYKLPEKSSIYST
jgi:hypothetical protein